MAKAGERRIEGCGKNKQGGLAMRLLIFFLAVVLGIWLIWAELEIVFLLYLVAFYIYLVRRQGNKVTTKYLPERFVVFDLETTGLTAGRNEIIEIGAIRVDKRSNQHDTFQTFVKPQKKVPKKITELTGITQEMIDSEGKVLHPAISEFANFVGELPLVAFNAQFDVKFLEAATDSCSLPKFKSPVACALNMARRAWPGRESYRLSSLAEDGKLSLENQHRALGDCERALHVYIAAASKLRSDGLEGGRIRPSKATVSAGRAMGRLFGKVFAK